MVNSQAVGDLEPYEAHSGNVETSRSCSGYRLTPGFYWVRLILEEMVGGMTSQRRSIVLVFFLSNLSLY
jgi:hypothetical protein